MNDKIGLLADGQQMLFEKFERLTNRFDSFEKSITHRVSILEMGQFTIEKEIKTLAKKLHQFPSKKNSQRLFFFG